MRCVAAPSSRAAASFLRLEGRVQVLCKRAGFPALVRGFLLFLFLFLFLAISSESLQSRKTCVSWSSWTKHVGYVVRGVRERVHATARHGLQQQQQRRHIKKALGRGAAALGSWTRLVPASGEASASASAFVACVHAPVLCWGKGFPGTNGGRCT